MRALDIKNNINYALEKTCTKQGGWHADTYYTCMYKHVELHPFFWLIFVAVGGVYCV